MIRIGIMGYGNLGRGVMRAIKQNPDMELVAVFTRREPSQLETIYPVQVENIKNVDRYKDKIDVMIMCGGSATDLPEQGAKYLKLFNTVDSFDTHARIPEYLEKMNKVGKESGKLGVISIGWDPGLFSMSRALFSSILPLGETYTFWGKGVSQGHSDAIRRIEGVKNAIQYTIPKKEAIDKVKSGAMPKLSAGDKHLRECFVVAKEGADKEKIEHEIKTMPNYFADYETIVHFISEEELKRDHSKMSHGGFVFRSGKTEAGDDILLETNISLESNPNFTSSVLVAFARAIYRLSKEGKTGAITAFDIPLYYLSPMDRNELIKNML